MTVVFFFIFYIVYVLLKPFLLAIITSLILVYVFYPVYLYLNKRVIKNRYACSAFVIVAIFLLISIPSFFILHSLARDGYDAYFAVRETLDDPTLFDCTVSDSSLCGVYTTFFTAEDSALVKDFLTQSVLNAGQTLWGQIYSVLASLPDKFIEFFIVVFLTFFLFVDGHKLLVIVRGLLPLKLEHEKNILKTIKSTTDAVVYGQVVTAVVQGLLAGLGFWAIGVPHALLFGVIVAFLAIIPFIGSIAVWLPLSLYFLFQGFSTGATGAYVQGGALAVYGVLFLSSIDYFVKPKIIGDRAKLHPALVFLGVIAGFSLFGLIGFFLGPIILAVFVTLIQIYENEKRKHLRGRRK